MSKVKMHDPPLHGKLLLSWEPHHVKSLAELIKDYNKEYLMSMARLVISCTQANGYDVGWTVSKSSKKEEVAKFLWNNVFNAPRNAVSPLPGLQRVNVLVLRPAESKQDE